MNTILHEIWPCLLAALLLGALLGWWLRRCKTRKMTNLKAHKEVAIHKYDSKNDAITLVSQEKNNVDDETIALKYHISKLEQELQSSKMKHVALENEYAYKLKQKEQSFFDRDSVINALKKDLSKLKEQKENEKQSLLNQHGQSSQALQKAQEELAQKEKELEQIEAQKRDIALQSHYYETEIKNLKESEANLQKKLQELEHAQSDKSKELQEKLTLALATQTKTNRAYEELEEQKQQLQEKLSSIEETYERKLKTLQDAYETKEKELHTLQQKEDAGREAFEKRLQEHKEHEKNLEVKVQDLEKALRHAKEKEHTLENKIDQALQAQSETKKALETAEKERLEALKQQEPTEHDSDAREKLVKVTMNNLQYRKEIEALSKENETLKKTIQNSESTSQAKPKFLEKPNGKVDNLQLIKGIGKTLEETLNHLGVYHFQQIAAWRPQEVTWVNKHLSFSGRIEREEWIKQAKALMQGEDTEFSKRVKDDKVPTSSDDKKSTLKRHKHKKRLHKK